LYPQDSTGEGTVVNENIGEAKRELGSQASRRGRLCTRGRKKGKLGKVCNRNRSGEKRRGRCLEQATSLERVQERKKRDNRWGGYPTKNATKLEDRFILLSKKKGGRGSPSRPNCGTRGPVGCRKIKSPGKRDWPPGVHNKRTVPVRITTDTKKTRHVTRKKRGRKLAHKGVKRLTQLAERGRCV